MCTIVPLTDGIQWPLHRHETQRRRVVECRLNQAGRAMFGVALSFFCAYCVNSTSNSLTIYATLNYFEVIPFNLTTQWGLPSG